MAKEYSAGAISYRKQNNQREFLIVQSIVNDKWGFSKGHLESNETSMQAAQREVFEEVGLKPKFDFNFSTKTHYFIPMAMKKKSLYF